MKTLRLLCFAVAALLARPAGGQGFVNLGFEQGLSASNTIPGWTAVAYGQPAAVYFNDLALSGGSVSLMSTNGWHAFPPMQRRYYVLITSANTVGFGAPTTFGQTGQIPYDTQSLTFWGDIGSLLITFNGQLLSFSVISNAPNYQVYGADVSAYAGQVGELLFTAPPYIPGGMGGYLDNIQFSTSPIPEPSTLALAALGAGAGALGWALRKKRFDPRKQD